MYIYKNYQDFFVRFLYNPQRYYELTPQRLALHFENFLESYLARQHGYYDSEILSMLLEKISMGEEACHASFQDDDEFETFTPDYVTDFICHSLCLIIIQDEEKGNKVREIIFNYVKEILIYEGGYNQ